MIETRLPAPSGNAGLGQLSDPGAYHDPIEISGEAPAWLDQALHRMVRIRVVEEFLAEHVRSGLIRCPCHLAIGQEACAVGVCTHLLSTDRVFGAHRSHGHYLALGGSVHGLLAEVLGRDTGVSRGMGGSMHLRDEDRGLYGTVPIVGATIPIAVGAALAARLDGTGNLAVSFFGDGAAEEGSFHESLNLAVMLRAPVLFVCENNFFSSHLRIDLRQPDDSIARFAVAHRIPWQIVDGNDVVAVSRAARQAVVSIRSGGGPQFLELVTYRWKGHVGWREDDDVGVRRKDDLPLWRRRDPIRRLADALATHGIVDRDAVARLSAEVRLEVDAAWARAIDDPAPPDSALLDRVYGSAPVSTASRGNHQ